MPDLQTIYLLGLIIAGSLALLYLLLGDVFDSIFDFGEATAGSILNPVVILSFIAIFSGSGYIFKLNGSMNDSTIIILSILISLLIVSLIHFFILVPLAKSEQSTASSIIDLVGKDGEVITTIPENGIGEILIASQFGSTGNIAKSITKDTIKEGTFVLVIDVNEEGVLIVTPYTNGKNTLI